MSLIGRLRALGRLPVSARPSLRDRLRGLVAALLVLAAASAALAQEAVKVESIDFEGIRRYSVENLKYSMRTKEGKLLDRDALARDMAFLRTYFEEFQVREEPVAGGGVRLVFTVKENPLVSRVEFVGNEEYRDDELRALLDTRTGNPLAAFRLEKDVLALERKFRDDGFHWIEVKAEVTDDEGARRVVFRVVQGPRVNVDAVAFEGNDSIPAKKLVPEMSLRPSKFLSPTRYVERRLEEDRVAL